MTRTRPLQMELVSELGQRARRCAYWETDGRTGERPSDSEFEKEAWISRVLLEWGVCGQVAEEQGRLVGAAFYAPPNMVPRARWFPTAPVSSDAVLLTAVSEEQSASDGNVIHALINGVVADIQSRGIKAIETFGLSTAGSNVASIQHELYRNTAQPVSDGCGAKQCVTDVSVLLEHGFTVVAPHHRFPRLRLELDGDHQWKADVEKALDQLFADSGIPLPRHASLAGVGA